MMQTGQVIDLGDLGQLIEYDIVAESNQQIKDIVQDLEGLRDIMIEFNVISVEQGEKLCQTDKNTDAAAESTEAANGELIKASDEINEKRQKVMRLMAIIGGGSVGTVGFMINPLIGIGAVAAGTGVGWLLTHNKTVDTLATVRFTKKNIKTDP